MPHAQAFFNGNLIKLKTTACGQMCFVCHHCIVLSCFVFVAYVSGELLNSHTYMSQTSADSVVYPWENRPGSWDSQLLSLVCKILLNYSIIFCVCCFILPLISLS